MHRFRSMSLLATLAACSGVSARPDRAEPDDLAVVQLGPGELVELAHHVDAAMHEVMRRRYQEAESAALAALALDPRSARAHAVLGMARMQLAAQTTPADLQVANAAETELRLAGKLAPDDAFVGFLSAVFLAETGHMSAAAAEAEAALARAKDAPAAERASLLGIAGTYRYELGEELAARPHLEAYVALRPDDATAHFRLGSTLLRIAAVPQGARHRRFVDAQANAELAARAFAQCCSLSPGDDDAAIAIALALWRAGELAQENGAAAAAEAHRKAAEDQLHTVVTRFPQNAEVWFRLGLIAEAKQQLAEAETAYLEALQRAPAHIGSALNLAALRDGRGDADGALVLWRRVLESDAAAPCLSARERQRLRARVHAPLGGS
ncbi:MAG: tetratricopeptide repeat protein [Planctomycetes bacterium]|nr:tetratricopeptide repeat protein [Planctomycetota bacterium]